MNILAIETSCDDTSAAVLSDSHLVSMFTSGQKIHKIWGGIVPIFARRAHDERIGPAIHMAMKQSGMKFNSIDAIAVTAGPGLAVSLESGISKAKELSEKHGIPLVPVNHLEGHFYAPFINTNQAMRFPALGLVVSGGHTEMFIAEGHGIYRILGRTLDDAAGEAFDKIGREMGFGYPAGPKIDSIAVTGTPLYSLPVPMRNKGYDFSYSGLKTAAISVIRKKKAELSGDEWEQFIRDFSASLQQTIAESIRIKVEKAVAEFSPEMLVVGGGVSANSSIRHALQPFNPMLPERKFCTDNAGMIGLAAYYRISNGWKWEGPVDRIPRWRIDDAQRFKRL